MIDVLLVLIRSLMRLLFLPCFKALAKLKSPVKPDTIRCSLSEIEKKENTREHSVLIMSIASSLFFLSFSSKKRKQDGGLALATDIV